MADPVAQTVTDPNTGAAVPVTGLPVAGFQPQSADNVNAVNINRVLEEIILERLDELAANSTYDQRFISMARSHIEQGFMTMNRAIFKPARVDLKSTGTFLGYVMSLGKTKTSV